MSLSKVPIPIPTQQATPYFFRIFCSLFKARLSEGGGAERCEIGYFATVQRRAFILREERMGQARKKAHLILSFESHDHQEPWSLGGAFD